MRPWFQIPTKDRMELLKLYKSQGYSYREAIDDFEGSLLKYEGGGGLPEKPELVMYGTPEYAAAYQQGKVTRYNPTDDTYYAQEIPEVSVTAKDGRIKKAIYEGQKEFLRKIPEFISQPQKQAVGLITGKDQFPSEAWGFDTSEKSWYHPKTVANFVIDVLLDPVNAIPGIGLYNLSSSTGRTLASRQIAKPWEKVGQKLNKLNKVVSKTDDAVKKFDKLDNINKNMDNEVQLTSNREGMSGDFLKDKTFINEGSEFKVYKDNEGNVFKIGEKYNAPETFNPRVEQALKLNEIGGVPLTLHGYWKSPNGTKNPIFKQPFIEGRPTLTKEIDDYMKIKNYKKTGNNTYENSIYKIEDLQVDNVLIDKDNKYHIIDAYVTKKLP